MPKRQAAWIEQSIERARVPCVIWDLSEGGARLAAPQAKSLPGTFTLLSRDGQSRRLCRIAWRTDAQVGIKFVETNDDEVEARAPQSPPAPSPPATQPFQPRIDGQVHWTSVRTDSAEAAVNHPSAISFLAATLAVLLAALAALFYFAGSRTGGQMGWSSNVCDHARNFCEHPSMTGIAALLMGFIFLMAKGMERN